MSYFGLRRGSRSTKVECTGICFVGKSAGEYCVRIRGNATAGDPTGAAANVGLFLPFWPFRVTDFEVVT
jgi:hypothetical protein